MTSLRERDLRAVLDLMGEVNDADDLDAFRLALLDALPRAVPTDYVSYNEIPPRVEYRMTPKGQELVEAVLSLLQWMRKWSGA